MDTTSYDRDYDIDNWDLDYMKDLNERLGKAGLPKLVIDEENKMVYKDELHKLLGIGIKVK